MQAVITGTGMCVPELIVKNEDLESMMNTSSDWIEERTGILERRFVSDGTTPSDLAYTACQNALQMSGLKISAIDLIIVATLSPEHYFPGTGSFLHSKLNADTTPVYEIRNQCSGFIYGLNIAHAMISSGKYHRILLVGVEVHSRGLDLTDRGRDVSVLFGDGAGAVIIEADNNPERGILAVNLHTEGLHAKKLWVEYPRTAESPFTSDEALNSGKLHPQMDGRFIFRNAVKRLPEVIESMLGSLHLTIKDIDYFLFHQANLRINETVAAQFGIPMSKVPSNIQKYGNCSAASIPMLLDENLRGNHVRPGHLVCLAAFGAGLTWGAAVVRM